MKQEILRFENVTCKKDGAVYLDNFSFYMTDVKATAVGKTGFTASWKGMKPPKKNMNVPPSW